eukprot:1150781-Pelagomonas_calceolata.AAC.1
MEKETHWLRNAASPLHHKATNLKVLLGIWRITGSTRLQDVAVKSIFVHDSSPSGNKLVKNTCGCLKT